MILKTLNTQGKAIKDPGKQMKKMEKMKSFKEVNGAAKE